MAFALSNPYKFARSETGFVFTTDLGVEYLFYVLDGSGYFDDFPEFASQVRSVGIAPVSAKEAGKKPLDRRIAATISAIIHAYFEQYPDVFMVWVCDSEDQRHRIRDRLFKRWFEVGSAEQYCKFDAYSQLGEADLLFSMLCLRSNPQVGIAKVGFENLEFQLQRKVA